LLLAGLCFLVGIYLVSFKNKVSAKTPTASVRDGISFNPQAL
jgi:hypothetical protein